MSGYLSNLLTQTTSRYNVLRRTLLSNEDDGDTEDDSHISRVLRAYYTEKARPFPPWLPADPNDRRAITPQPGTQQGYFTSAGGRSQYGAAGVQQQQQQQNGAGARGSLSDLWDSPGGGGAQAAPQSLRAGRRVPGGARPETHSMLVPPAQARPLPSQRAGSYQNVGLQRRGATEASPPSSSGGGSSSAQDRLRQRLWGAARSASPGSSGTTTPTYSGSQNPYDQPASEAGGGSSRRFGR